MTQVIHDMQMSELLTYEYASYFEHNTLEIFGELATSFNFEDCLKWKGLNKILQEDTEIKALHNNAWHFAFLRDSLVSSIVYPSRYSHSLSHFRRL